MEKNFHRVEARIDRRAERFPIRLGFANGLRLWSVARDQAIEAGDRDFAVNKVKNEQQKHAAVNAAGQSESLPPFAPFRELSAALPPTFRQKIKLYRSRRRFDSNQRSFALENFRNLVAQLETRFVEQHVRK